VIRTKSLGLWPGLSPQPRTLSDRSRLVAAYLEKCPIKNLLSKKAPGGATLALPGVNISWYPSVWELRDVVACSGKRAFRHEPASGQVEQQTAELDTFDRYP
jgi:hypothetical protein